MAIGGVFGAVCMYRVMTDRTLGISVSECAYSACVLGDCVWGGLANWGGNVVVVGPCPAVCCIVIEFCFEAVVTEFDDLADV